MGGAAKTLLSVDLAGVDEDFAAAVCGFSLRSAFVCVLGELTLWEPATASVF